MFEITSTTALSSGDTVLTISKGITGKYVVLGASTWNTDWYVSSKLLYSFNVNFSTITPSGGQFDWTVVSSNIVTYAVPHENVAVTDEDSAIVVVSLGVFDTVDELILKNAIIERTTLFKKTEIEYKDSGKYLRTERVERPYYSFEITGNFYKSSVESLDAFFRRHKHNDFWFDGNDWGYITNRQFVAIANSGTEYYLHNRYINPDSISVSVNDGITDSVTTDFELKPNTGKIIFDSNPTSGHKIFASYANYYAVRFSTDIELKESVRYKDSYIASFKLEESFKQNTRYISTPFSINALQIFVQANSLNGGLSSGTTVDTWNDLSGNLNHFTATSGPIYVDNQLNGLPIVAFDATSQVMYTDNPLGLAGDDIPFTAFIVGKVNSLEAGAQAFITLVSTNADDNYHQIGISNVGSLRLVRRRAAQVDNYTNQLSPGVWYIISHRFTGTYGDAFINGTIVTNSVNLDVGSVGFDRLSMGALGRPSITNFLNGDIFSILVYNSELTNLQRHLVEQYLSDITSIQLS